MQCQSQLSITLFNKDPCQHVHVDFFVLTDWGGVNAHGLAQLNDEE